ncbi:hypothetical protein DTL42_25520 [Bremerella cremea]|uniref:Uncharacterized protein n=1 Tax=Bremerella cremea TaxID=1031537 RepID=A0A368KN21_9BACT|nr:hypothetical protein [Bremerella cremea]RCS40725.1 hypothetical protein DTL42_25520 [Bremerella cremea]
MASQSKQTNYLIGGIIAALALWGIYLAIGSYLGMGEKTRQFDIRRGLIVAGCMATFLLFWGALLWNRQRNLPSDDE